MNIIDATTVSALLVVLALAVLAVVVTAVVIAGVVLARIYGASSPAAGTAPSYLAVPGRVVAISH